MGKNLTANCSTKKGTEEGLAISPMFHQRKKTARESSLTGEVNHGRCRVATLEMEAQESTTRISKGDCSFIAKLNFSALL